MHQAGHASLGLQKRLLSRQITSIETTSCKGRLRSLLAEAVEAQRARAGKREIQVDEAEKDRQFALIQQLVEVSRSVGHEVRERHFPRQDERNRASEEPDENQRATDHLEAPSEAEERIELHGRSTAGARARDRQARRRRPAAGTAGY